MTNTLETILARTEVNHETECLEWQGTLNRGGYGLVSFENKQQSVHRLVYRLENPDMPKELHVLHRCDNRRCINIDHLFLGTNQDNVDDRMSKGRQGKFVWDKSREEEAIRLLESGMTQREVSKKLSMCVKTIKKFTEGKFNPEKHGYPKRTRLYNENDNLIFESATAAASYLRRTPSPVRKAAKSGKKCAGYFVEYV
jgi:hypothetical protein